MRPESNEVIGVQLELGSELEDVTDKQLLHRDDDEQVVEQSEKPELVYIELN